MKTNATKKTVAPMPYFSTTYLNRVFPNGDLTHVTESAVIPRQIFDELWLNTDGFKHFGLAKISPNECYLSVVCNSKELATRITKDDDRQPLQGDLMPRRFDEVVLNRHMPFIERDKWGKKVIAKEHSATEVLVYATHDWGCYLSDNFDGYEPYPTENLYV